jgi:hypothetical protein
MNARWIRQNLSTFALLCLAFYAPIFFGVFYTAATMRIHYDASILAYVAVAPGVLLTHGLPTLAKLGGGSPGLPGLVLSILVTVALIGGAIGLATRSRNALAWTTLGTLGLSSVLAVVFVMLQRM